MNKYGGKPCHGDIRETKSEGCHKDCEKPVDCVLSTWTDWSTCAVPNGQSYRTRDISTMMKFGGKVCEGALHETRWCTEVKAPVDCIMGEWSDWNKCTTSCGGGTKSKKRTIQTQSAYGGKPCTGSLEEATACNNDPCDFKEHPVNCKLGDWTAWLGDEKSFQKQRDRSIMKQPQFGGEPCNGTLQEIAPIDPVDCKLQDWGPWDTCDKPCENGQQQRKRQVDQHPRFGGAACEYPLSLLEVQGCTGNDKNCDSHAKEDAKVNNWSPWTKCTTPCGPGQQTRMRDVKQNRGHLGVGFTGELKETRPCPTSADHAEKCDVQDCKWESWSQWSACSKPCDGGQQDRSRGIAQRPKHLGKACDALPGRETQPCNTVPCNTGKCVNGTWHAWSDWSACSSTCLGGVQSRHRTIKQVANSCGYPVTGPDRIFRGCNAAKQCSDTDCEFSDWKDWGACTMECDGVARRQRDIKTMGSGVGKFCEGGLTELKTCNPSSENTDKCASVVKADCKR